MGRDAQYYDGHWKALFPIGGLCSVLERGSCLFLVGITLTSCWMLLDGLKSCFWRVLNQTIVSDVARLHLDFILCDDSLHSTSSLTEKNPDAM